MKKRYIVFFISFLVISNALAVIAAFHYGLVLKAGRIPWLLPAAGIALLLLAVFFGIRYRRAAPMKRRLFLSLAIGDGALGLSGLAVALYGPSTSHMMNWILIGLLIFSVLLKKGMVLFSALKLKDDAGGRAEKMAR
jgi:hypothetical protein